jgi:hypothetical protein
LIETDDVIEEEREAPADTPSAALTPMLGLGICVVGALAAVAAAASRNERGPLRDLPRGESVLFRTRPRRALGRYAASLGLWELSRRSTSFAVTDRRVIVERGLLRRHSHSIPLTGIVSVDVVAGPWQGIVRIGELAGGAGRSEELGPLRAGSARTLGSTITRAIASY